MKIFRKVQSTRVAEDVFEYVSDFTKTEEWDPGTVTTVRLHGDGGVGTRYRNVSRFLGRETELEYEVISFEPGASIHLRGTGDNVVADDRIAVRELPDGGSELTYDAHFRFSGVARLLAPLVAPAFKRLGDRAERRLGEVLN
jgi:hypothetical protein